MHLVRRIETTDPVVFVTIDDGFTRDEAAAKFIIDHRWPITSFVMPEPLAADVAWFENVSAGFGTHGSRHIGMHGMRFERQRRNICDGAAYVAALTGQQPVWFRPPFGSHDDTTVEAAAACGMHAVLLWKVTVNGRVISTWGGPIRPGDIILMHYRGSLAISLEALSEELDRLGLHPADLADYLA